MLLIDTGTVSQLCIAVGCMHKLVRALITEFPEYLNKEYFNGTISFNHGNVSIIEARVYILLHTPNKKISYCKTDHNTIGIFL